MKRAVGRRRPPHMVLNVKRISGSGLDGLGSRKSVGVLGLMQADALVRPLLLAVAVVTAITPLPIAVVTVSVRIAPSAHVAAYPVLVQFRGDFGAISVRARPLPQSDVVHRNEHGTVFRTIEQLSPVIRAITQTTALC